MTLFLPLAAPVHGPLESLPSFDFRLSTFDFRLSTFDFCLLSFDFLLSTLLRTFAKTKNHERR
jgi:hypothetical protein